MPRLMQPVEQFGLQLVLAGVLVEQLGAPVTGVMLATSARASERAARRGRQ